ncbi:60S acidic ribosomal protein P1-beta Short=P1B; AltName: Full=YP1beta; AltName: Full=Ax; AltName: Full=L44'; AltName: Full=L12EIIB [Cyberlindnera jadinii]|uniref:Ribosomal protein 60S n=1 Tax=Cyberlindnera jadinii (strain ATCC 18201 / CBS 1600 / BCRC 20928 / JCM 3617 / NBRC 0987 / NRRL Y-1542) TaxID=983966 RepID=A0A0H5BZH5_CYBJN|nr:ribosomal protein 60S [Cyberlindnera jadinii NRRL Y-1542]ODV76070.1 ribosomal protein 60S [Cyberlindnera jadinii NRRL Y-1542]CEP20756.1 60S acidic ribosomal protein P1-beta Short=P1B; AltName: Full=YP1beta; AltName: Full=Ax; AltName: Full=L44'; AltName: Full=L12EIIB [Cyberlindnera jadinii]
MSDAIVSYAALILADAGLDITADNLATLTKAAGASVDQVWINVFATALEGKDLKEILAGFAAAGPAPAASGAGAAASGATEAAAEEAEEEAAEESDDDMGFGLFD